MIATASAPAASRADLAQRLAPTEHAQVVGVECERITHEGAEDVQAAAWHGAGFSPPVPPPRTSPLTFSPSRP